MRLVRVIIQHRWAILVFLAAFTAWGAALAPRLRFDFTPQAVFQGNDDLVLYDEDFKKTFGYEDAVLLVVMEAAGPRDVLDRQALTWQGQVARELAALPRVQRVESVATLKTTRGAMSLLLGLAPLVPRLPATAQDEARVRQAVAAMPLVRGELVSTDGKTAKLVVFIDPAARELGTMRDVVGSVRAALGSHPMPEGYLLHLSGLPVLRMDIVQSLRADLFFLLPAAGVLFLVILTLEYRSIAGTLLPLLAVGAGLAWTVGVLVTCGQEMNIVSNVLPVMLFVIGIANGVHMISRYAEDSERLPLDRIGATQRTMSFMLLACLLTSATTAVGFGSLVAARSHVLRALGLHAMIGVSLLYVSTILVMGTLLPSFRAPRFRSHHELRSSPVSRLAGWLGIVVARRPRWALAAGLVVIGVSVVVARDVRVNSRMLETYEESQPTLKTLRLVERQLGGLLPLEISLQSETEQKFLEVDAYRLAAEAQAFAAHCPAVISTRSYVDLLQEIRVAVGGDETIRTRLPEDGAAGRQALQLAGTMARQAGGLVHLETFLSPDGRRARILLRVRDLGTQQTLALIRELEEHLGRLFPPSGGITARLTGDACIHALAMDRFIRDLLWSLASATVIIFGIIGLLFWSLRLGLIAVLPNLTPLLVTLAYMVWRGYDLNAGNVVVFAVSIGIAVDNTIHFMARFREEVKVDGNVAEAIHRSYLSAGRAVVFASILIISGLSVLMLSSFVPSRHFAELTGVTLVAALLGNLLLLPACLILLWKRTGPGPSKMAANRGPNPSGQRS